MRVDFAEWRPDLPDTDMGASHVAENVLPSLGGYIPFKSIVPYSQALDERCRGATALRDHDASSHVFAGDAGKLYELQGDGSWTDESKSGGYATSISENWNFAQFGRQVIATNFDDNPQVFTMGTATAFSDLPGSPPRARYVKTLRDFLVLSGCSCDPTRVKWSAINDSSNWTAGSNQSGDQVFPDHGFCQGVFGSEVGYVFFDTAIYRMTYVGPPLVFKFNEISHGRGALNNRMIVEVGGMIFFAAQDGFYMLRDDQMTPIGHEKVDEFFLADVQPVYAHRASAAADPVNKVVMWSYASVDSVDGSPDTIIAYSWATERWSYIKYDVEFIASILSLGYTLDTLDNLTASLDSFNIPLDSPVLAGGSLQFAGFGPSHELGLFIGAAEAATLETKEWTLSPNARTFVRGIRPLVEASDLTVSVGSRDRAADPVSYSSPVVQESHGLVPLRQTGRYHRARVVIPAGSNWGHAQAVEFDAVEVGRR